MVVGSGSQVGDELVENPAVKAVSFTGSNEIGTRLYAQGARRQLPCQCEMGGKNPVIVLPDADLDQGDAALSGWMRSSHRGSRVVRLRWYGPGADSASLIDSARPRP